MCSLSRCISVSSHNVCSAGQRLPLSSYAWERCGLTRAAVDVERAFTEVRGRSGGGYAPVGRGRAWSVSARLAPSSPHTHRPPERGVIGTHIYHWGTAVGLPGTGHSSPLHAHAHTRTHCKNTTLVLRTLEPCSTHTHTTCVLCKS